MNHIGLLKSRIAGFRRRSGVPGPNIAPGRQGQRKHLFIPVEMKIEFLQVFYRIIDEHKLPPTEALLDFQHILDFGHAVIAAVNIFGIYIKTEMATQPQGGVMIFVRQDNKRVILALN